MSDLPIEPTHNLAIEPVVDRLVAMTEAIFDAEIQPILERHGFPPESFGYVYSGLLNAASEHLQERVAAELMLERSVAGGEAG